MTSECQAGDGSGCGAYGSCPGRGLAWSSAAPAVQMDRPRRRRCSPDWYGMPASDGPDMPLLRFPAGHLPEPLSRDRTRIARRERRALRSPRAGSAATARLHHRPSRRSGHNGSSAASLHSSDHQSRDLRPVRQRAPRGSRQRRQGALNPGQAQRGANRGCPTPRICSGATRTHDAPRRLQVPNTGTCKD